jgi:hypothetical protein
MSFNPIRLIAGENDGSRGFITVLPSNMTSTPNIPKIMYRVPVTPPQSHIEEKYHYDSPKKNYPNLVSFHPTTRYVLYYLQNISVNQPYINNLKYQEITATP